jgi:hypothetical protein
VTTNGNVALPCAELTAIVNPSSTGAPAKNTCTYHEPSAPAVVLADPYGDDTSIVEPAAAVPPSSS